MNKNINKLIRLAVTAFVLKSLELTLQGRVENLVEHL